MINLPTLPFGGWIGVGMMVGSLFTKKGTKKFLFWGGLGLTTYTVVANGIKLITWSEDNFPGLNKELLKGLGFKSSNYGTYNTVPYGDF